MVGDPNIQLACGWGPQCSAGLGLWAPVLQICTKKKLWPGTWSACLDRLREEAVTCTVELNVRGTEGRNFSEMVDLFRGNGLYR